MLNDAFRCSQALFRKSSQNESESLLSSFMAAHLERRSQMVSVAVSKY